MDDPSVCFTPGLLDQQITRALHPARVSFVCLPVGAAATADPCMFFHLLRRFILGWTTSNGDPLCIFTMLQLT